MLQEVSNGPADPSLNAFSIKSKATGNQAIPPVTSKQERVFTARKQHTVKHKKNQMVQRSRDHALSQKAANSHMMTSQELASLSQNPSLDQDLRGEEFRVLNS